jgi:chromosome segregation protein
MKLRTLKVHGFKSFADSTTVEFHDGITAVVGPNGCGKSNIGDAIRWVLGEQRPTAIRGAKMEEAIFQGTVGRRPVNRGSVSLVVSNEDGSLPVPFEEVELGRQVFRDGGSEYAINRSACRLRDVVDLCRDTGLGANAYAIIENRMIDAILSDRAEERRGLFEEAAGIGKYKDRRKAATRRLERAEMDLQRLEDVIGEVQTKVRSLARQKGKAQRFLEYRKRRLDVEVAVVRHQLETLRDRLSGVEKELEDDARSGEGMVAELGVAEAEYESLRLKQVDAERERTARAEALEAVRTDLIRWERDLAVADERAAYAERRLAQIGEERADALSRAESLERDERGLSAERDGITGELEDLRTVSAERAEEVEAARARLMDARGRLDGVEGRARELARRGAQLEGDAEASDAQASELAQRLVNAGQELASTARELAQLESQGDLFSGRLEDLQEQLEQALARLETRLGEFTEAREALETARRVEREATEAAMELGARRSALEALERDREGVEPVVRAVLDLEEDGVLGPVADFIGGDAASVSAVEAYLGPMARALVVRDQKALDRVLAWFYGMWEGGSGLILLPLDRLPETATKASGGLLDRVTTAGEGAAWVRALLDQVEVPEGVVGERTVTIRRGVVRVGNPAGGTGILERKEQLRQLVTDHDAAMDRQARVRKEREEAEERLQAADATLEAVRSEWREAEDEQRRASSELRAQSDQQGRMDRARDELARQVEGAKAARSRAVERAQEARQDRAILLEQESGLVAEREEAQRELETVQEEWETARAVESRIAVDLARFEGE